MRYLGVDYGKKRIGIAISDEQGKFAFPERVIANDKQAEPSPSGVIAALCTEHSIDTIIVGESKNFKGADNSIMTDVRHFVDELHQLGLTVILEPEMMSTIQAERIQGVREDIDASAAAVILQSYLDRQLFKDERAQQEAHREAHKDDPIGPDKYTVIDDAVDDGKEGDTDVLDDEEDGAAEDENKDVY